MASSCRETPSGAFEGVDEHEALAYLQATYGARITTVDALLSETARLEVS